MKRKWKENCDRYPVTKRQKFDEGLGRRTSQANLLCSLDLSRFRIFTGIRVGNADRQRQLDLKLLLKVIEIRGRIRRGIRFPNPGQCGGRGRRRFGGGRSRGQRGVRFPKRRRINRWWAVVRVMMGIGYATADVKFPE